MTRNDIIADLNGTFFDNVNECWRTDKTRMDAMTNSELLEAYLNSEMMFGYADQIIAAIEAIYGITLTD